MFRIKEAVMSIRNMIARKTQCNYRLNRKVLHMKHCVDEVNSVLDALCAHGHKPKPAPSPPPKPPRPKPCPPPCFPCCPFCPPPKPPAPPCPCGYAPPKPQPKPPAPPCPGSEPTPSPRPCESHRPEPGPNFRHSGSRSPGFFFPPFRF